MFVKTKSNTQKITNPEKYLAICTWIWIRIPKNSKIWIQIRRQVMRIHISGNESKLILSTINICKDNVLWFPLPDDQHEERAHVVNAALCQLFPCLGSHRHTDTRTELLNLQQKQKLKCSSVRPLFRGFTMSRKISYQGCRAGAKALFCQVRAGPGARPTAPAPQNDA